MLLGCCHCEPDSINYSGSRGSSQSASENAPFPPTEPDAGCGACTLFPQRWSLTVPDFKAWNQTWVDYWESWDINQPLTLTDCGVGFTSPGSTHILEFDSRGAAPGGYGYLPKWRGPWASGGYPGYYPAPVVVCGYWASQMNAINITDGCKSNPPFVDPPCQEAFVADTPGIGPFAPWRDRIPQWELMAYQPTIANSDRDWITFWHLQWNYQYGCKDRAASFGTNVQGLFWQYAINRLLTGEPRKSCVVPITFAASTQGRFSNWDYPEHDFGAYSLKPSPITIEPV